MIELLIIGIILFILLFRIYQNKNNKNQIVEGFYTLFFPYYDPQAITAQSQQFQTKSISQLNTITFYIHSRELQLLDIRVFIRVFSASSKTVLNINTNSTDNDTEIIKLVNQNGNNFGIVPAPVLVNRFINGSFPNLRFVSTMSDQYAFVLVNQNSNIQRLEQLTGRTIGLGDRGSVWERVGKDILSNINPYYGSFDDTVKKLNNMEIDGMVITDEFPSPRLNYITYNFPDILILPVQGIRNLDSYYESTTVDLAELPATYLPRVIDGVRYIYFNSSMNTIKFKNILITNNKTDDAISYEMTQHIFDRNKLLRKSSNPFLMINIPIQNGAREYYIENGYIVLG